MSTKYKFFVLFAAVALLAAGCSGQPNNPAAPTATNQPPPAESSAPAPSEPMMMPMPMSTSTPPPAAVVPNIPACPANEYSCKCATGSYCLMHGAMCVSPNSPCPGAAPTPSPSPKPTPTPAPAPSSASISISNFAFSPASLTVKKGTTVTWTNQDGVTHTVTGDNGGPSSGDLANGQSYSYTFNQTGTFTYHCSIHTFMKATVIVQ